ncbi:hypothetical protein CEUSTIGMA_g3710.t1 [Chlamydomonas eustigma]|uniref:Uncharacterized protein n=1 Tax=Chlamydomonas eustigma TaxID=1157962 RepID=A0A250WZQ7_9CHLO|nr:hypothetical protein CEUSTIGMA_g3710.t1 [Chlamydomonas eustigma]|eukprot:GAX76266.1 hypothetical protein CEUSTIGMA_g3710.t1 [Chlamydomonas eustigma]
MLAVNYAHGKKLLGAKMMHRQRLYPGRALIRMRNISIFDLAGGRNGDGTPASNFKPSKQVLDLWQRADAVCFDIDCTITVNDSICWPNIWVLGSRSQS